jgi:DNA-binding LytR/AlgR family response regulator
MAQIDSKNVEKNLHSIELSKVAAIKILILEDEIHAHAFKENCEAYLPKPYSTEELETTLASLGIPKPTTNVWRI